MSMAEAVNAIEDGRLAAIDHCQFTIRSDGKPEVFWHKIWTK